MGTGLGDLGPKAGPLAIGANDELFSNSDRGACVSYWRPEPRSLSRAACELVGVWTPRCVRARDRTYQVLGTNVMHLNYKTPRCCLQCVQPQWSSPFVQMGNLVQQGRRRPKGHSRWPPSPSLSCDELPGDAEGM